MLWLSKQKFFNHYLPMFLSVVLVVAALATYLTLRPQTPVAEAAVGSVQTKTSSFTTTASQSVTFTGNVTSGNIIAFAGNTFAAVVPTSATSSCVTGNLNITNTATSTTAGGISIFQGYGVVSSSGSCTVTVNYPSSIANNIVVDEIRGVNAASPTDGTALQLNALGTAADSGGITTAKSGDYIFGALFDAAGNGITWSGFPAGFTQRAHVNGGTTLIDGVQNIAGAIDVTATASGGTDPGAGIIAFQPRAGGFVQQGGKFRQRGGLVLIGGTGFQPPQFVGNSSSTWDGSGGSPGTTGNVNTNIGDTLVAYSACRDQSCGTLSITSSPSLTWVLEQGTATSTNFSPAYIWTSTAAANGNVNVTCTSSGGAAFMGCDLLVFRNAGGVGNSAQNNGTGSNPSVNLTSTSNNSAIVALDTDWNAVAGSATWNAGAGSFTQLDNYIGSVYSVHGGYYPNATYAQTYAVGMTAPTGQRWEIVALEIKGVRR